MNELFNAVVVGIVFLLIAIPVMWIQQLVIPKKEMTPYKYWVSTVLTGVLGYYFMDRKWGSYYCGKK